MTAGAHSASRVDVVTGSHTSAIWVGDGLLDNLRSRLDAHGVGAKRFVVSSPRIWRHHGPTIQQAIPGDPILIPDGERHKTLASVSRIYDALIRGGADRGSTVVAVGGGVVGDTAGFAAASFLRGIALVQVPTTLLAQVDIRHRRQGGRQPRAGQEPDRRVSPARRWSSPTRACCGRCRAGSSAPGCTRWSSTE